MDASDIAIGSVLMQRTPPNWFRPVYYTSHRLSQAEKNYSTTEKEEFGMIYSISKFRHDLCQRMGQPNDRNRMPHQPILLLEPFQKNGD